MVSWQNSIEPSNREDRDMSTKAAVSFDWRRDCAWHSANAEHAIVGSYELVVFDVPPGLEGDDRLIGWELFTGVEFMEQIERGDAASMELAKVSAEAAYRAIVARSRNRTK